MRVSAYQADISFNDIHGTTEALQTITRAFSFENLGGNWQVNSNLVSKSDIRVE